MCRCRCVWGWVCVNRLRCHLEIFMAARYGPKLGWVRKWLHSDVLGLHLNRLFIIYCWIGIGYARIFPMLTPTLPSNHWDDWRCENEKHCTVKNTGMENARLENAAPVCRGWKMRDRMLWNAENAITNKTLKWIINTRRRKYGPFVILISIRHVCTS